MHVNAFADCAVITMRTGCLVECLHHCLRPLYSVRLRSEVSVCGRDLLGVDDLLARVSQPSTVSTFSNQQILYPHHSV